MLFILTSHEPRCRYQSFRTEKSLHPQKIVISTEAAHSFIVDREVGEIRFSTSTFNPPQQAIAVPQHALLLSISIRAIRG
jgi:hypothetical protein